MLRLILKYGKYALIVLAIVISVTWFISLLKAKKDLAVANAQLVLAELTIDDMKVVTLDNNTYIVQLQGSIQEMSIRTDIYRKRILAVSKANNKLEEELLISARSIEEEDLGDTCEKQVAWVVAHVGDLSKW